LSPIKLHLLCGSNSKIFAIDTRNKVQAHVNTIGSDHDISLLSKQINLKRTQFPPYISLFGIQKSIIKNFWLAQFKTMR
jgi:hypothetical protein